ncbi:apoptosis facilitator Bcl-2-like protein 14 isoform X2 [Puntigrus tetrazona]|uniref:apoptosis facilitator Bcl-2-like protein 14 isoform X2 n=1 Tax=Puntigrus tetrazona TaxID=1606681 RepID=UPI001C8AC09D|nr:apoptosis facilitator Bcl-2-like protein 14 isoform X2 [Puntigrus tetrazona]
MNQWDGWEVSVESFDSESPLTYSVMTFCFGPAPKHINTVPKLRFAPRKPRTLNAELLSAYLSRDQQHSNGDARTFETDSLEFKLLMAYTRKRRPTEALPSSPQPDEDRSKPKRKGRKPRLSFLIKCIKPQTNESPVQQPATLSYSDDKKADDLEDMVCDLTEISDSVQFTPCDIEPDSDDVVEKLVELLREHGDKLDKKIKEDKVLHEKLQSSLTYGFFKKVMESLCGSVSPDVPPEQKDQKVSVALVCEATSQLVGVHYHPMTYVLGLGAQYLQEKYSTWINRNVQGKVSDESKEEVQ